MLIQIQAGKHYWYSQKWEKIFMLYFENGLMN